MPRNYKSVAAIIPFAAKHHHTLLHEVRPALRDEFRHAQAGIFHQRQTRNAVAGSREPVHFPHFSSAQYFHAGSSGSQEFPRFTAEMNSPTSQLITIYRSTVTAASREKNVALTAAYPADACSSRKARSAAANFCRPPLPRESLRSTHSFRMSQAPLSPALPRRNSDSEIARTTKSPCTHRPADSRASDP